MQCHCLRTMEALISSTQLLPRWCFKEVQACGYEARKHHVHRFVPACINRIGMPLLQHCRPRFFLFHMTSLRNEMLVCWLQISRAHRNRWQVQAGDLEAMKSFCVCHSMWLFGTGKIILLQQCSSWGHNKPWLENAVWKGIQSFTSLLVHCFHAAQEANCSMTFSFIGIYAIVAQFSQVPWIREIFYDFCLKESHWLFC